MKQFLQLCSMSFVAAAVGCSGEDTNTPWQSGTQVGDSGAITFRLETDESLAEGTNRFRLTLKNVKDDKPFVGASVLASAFMPTMDHGPPSSPVISEASNGTYVVDNVVFSMAGLWQLDVRATRDAVEDQTTFSLEVD